MTNFGFIIVLWAGLLFGGLFFVWLVFRSPTVRSIVRSTRFRIAIQYFQLFGVPLFVDLKWPPVIIEILRVAMAIVRLDFIEFGAPECAVRLSWVLKWIL